MPQYEFGSGVLVGINTTAAGVQTPREFGVLQDVSVDFAATTKQLFGQYQFPVAVGRGTAKITGKAKFARIVSGIYNDLFFNGSLATGQTIQVSDEQHTVGSATITPTNNTTYVTDLGIKYGANGLATDGQYLTKVASAPAVGQYTVSVSAGVATYAFNSSDNTHIVMVSYSYTIVTGETLTITNPLLGTAPAFALHLKQTYLGHNLYMKLNQCISSKLNFATKLEDFMIPEMDFECFADASNQVGVISVEE